MIKKAISGFLSDDMMKNLAKASSGPFVIRILGLGIAYAFTILLTREYGASVFGLYALGMVVMNICSVVARLGVDTAAVKMLASFIKLGENNRVAGFYFRGLLLVSGIALSLLAVLYYMADDIGAGLFSKPELAPYIQAFACSLFPFTIIQYHAEVIRGLGYPTMQSFFQTLALPISGMGIFVIMRWLLHYDIPIFDIYLLSVSLVCLLSICVVIWTMAKGRYSIKDARRASISYREILRFSLPMFLFGSLLLLSDWVNILMLGRLATEEDVGVYKVIVRISSLNVLVLVAVNTIIAPKIAALHAKGDARGLIRETKKATKLIFWSSLPIQFFLYAFGGILLGVFGEEFMVGLLPLYIILSGQLFNSISGPVAQVLNMTNGQSFLGRLAFYTLLLTIASNWLLLTYLPALMAIAISMLLNKVLFNVVCMAYIKRKQGFWTFYIPGLTRG